MDKNFDGLIHTKMHTLSSMPQYNSNYYTKEELETILQAMNTKFDKKFIDEVELNIAIEDVDVIDAGGAPSEEGGE